MSDTPATKLTDRQRQVAELVAEGISYRNIADQLGISRDTVITHVRAIDGKIEASGHSPYIRVMRWALANAA